MEPAPLAARSRRTARQQVRILAVDDDPQALRYVRDALVKAGYAPVVTGDPEDVPRLMEEERPGLVLLDLMLPGSDGIELMKAILKTTDVPVIFLSVYGQEDVVARAFDMGAADYVVKPFSPTELAARIRAALRRRAGPYGAEPTGPHLLGDLTIDYAQRRVTVAGRPVRLTATEYGLLYELSVNIGRVLTHDQLLRRVWGLERTGEPGLVPQRGEEAPAQAGRRRGQPHLHLHRAPRRLPHGEASEAPAKTCRRSRARPPRPVRTGGSISQAHKGAGSRERPSVGPGRRLNAARCLLDSGTTRRWENAIQHALKSGAKQITKCGNCFRAGDVVSMTCGRRNEQRAS